MKHFLDIHTTDKADLRSIIDQALAMKTARNNRPKGTPDDEQPLAGRMVALIFEKPSTRTRVSFDLGVRQMGGQTMVLSGAEMQLGHGETIADTARVMSRYVDLIMIRTFEEATLQEMAEHASVPVINGLTNRTHPCQIMADVMTFEEHRGPIAGKKVVWSGDGNNVCHSFMHAAPKFGFHLNVACPAEYHPDLRDLAKGGAAVTLTSDPRDAVKGADVVVTDTWVSMGDQDYEARLAAFESYGVDDGLMDLADEDAVFLHCLPAHRGEEVTDAVIDGPRSLVWDEAENRVHAQKAVLAWCFGG
mgnify:CR=1 FL=1